jgi:prephenate dehydrogenase
MQQFATVAIVGVGLIGGSIGKALVKRRLARRVIGIGLTRGRLAEAKRLGAVSEIATSLRVGVAEADLVIVCTPVDTIVRLVLEAAQACPAGALITDAGSTKAEIVAAVNRSIPRRATFVGSHPLAGSEKTGPAAARADLLQDRVVVITPTAATARRDVSRLSQFWSSLGANVVRMSPDKHDQIVSEISHVPHLVAAALAAATPRKPLSMAAGGWHDTTRVAAGDPRLWTPIFTTNRAAVLKSLARFEKTLTSVRRALESGDDDALAKLLAQAKRRLDAAGG